MGEMTMGQYLPGQSPMHRLDARLKIIGLCVLIGVIVNSVTPIGYLISVALVLLTMALTSLPWKYFLGSIQRLWYFFLVIFFMNTFFFDGENPWFSWWIFRPSLAGLTQGIHVILHVILIMVLCNVFLRTTSPMAFTNGLSSLLRPLKLFFLPVEEIAMILSVSMQFIPILAEETETIKKAQIARGARFESGKLLERAASYVPLVVPIFLSAFRRADDLAQAMEARGYLDGRTKRKLKKEQNFENRKELEHENI